MNKRIPKGSVLWTDRNRRYKLHKQVKDLIKSGEQITLNIRGRSIFIPYTMEGDQIPEPIVELAKTFKYSIQTQIV